LGSCTVWEVVLCVGDKSAVEVVEVVLFVGVVHPIEDKSAVEDRLAVKVFSIST